MASNRSTAELIYRFKVDASREIHDEGERGVERLLDRLRETGYAEEVAKRRKVGGQTWLTIEYRFDVGGPSDLDDVWPYELRDAQQAGQCEITSVRLMRQGRIKR